MLFILSCQSSATKEEMITDSINDTILNFSSEMLNDSFVDISKTDNTNIDSLRNACLTKLKLKSITKIKALNEVALLATYQEMHHLLVSSSDSSSNNLNKILFSIFEELNIRQNILEETADPNQADNIKTKLKLARLKSEIYPFFNFTKRSNL